MKVVTPPENIAAAPEKIYALASDCRNFEKFLADRCSKWSATENDCSFAIPNIAEMQLSIVEKNAFSKVAYRVANDKNIPVNLTIDIAPNGTGSTISVALDAEVPSFLSVMIQKPLQMALDKMMSKIKSESEKMLTE